MLVVMQHDATPSDVENVCRTIVEMGYEARPLPGAQRTAVGHRRRPATHRAPRHTGSEASLSRWASRRPTNMVRCSRSTC